MKTDVLIIGGGPAGMAAALGCAENGTKCTIVERNSFLGGILRQCIHNGFGLHYLNEELTAQSMQVVLKKKLPKTKILKLCLTLL